MSHLVLRNPDQARRHLLAGLWLSRVAAPAVLTLPRVLQCALCLASEGHPLPPIGFLADVTLLALGGQEAPPLPAGELPGVAPGLVRQYEDYVLGKLYADLSFERAADAVLGYADEDRSRGVAYTIERMLEQTGCGGVLLSPAAIRSLQQVPPEDVLHDGWQALSSEGLSPEAIRQYEELIDAVRSTGNLLAPEDVFELEHGTALVEFGQRLALRQVLQSATLLAETLPRQRPRASTRRRQVATRLLDEDAYPVGGFSSISTKGSIESLLHSQLAFIEPDERPDLFDIKYVRDELLYYARDENQFLRRRSTLVVALMADLAAARVKDSGFPFQRIVLALGLVVAMFRKLSDWLSDESLELHVVLIAKKGEHPLADEQALLELIFSDAAALGTARIECLSREKLLAAIASHARRSVVECLVVATAESNLACDQASVTQLLLSAAEPHLCEVGQSPYWSEEKGIDAWRDVLQALLRRWL